MALDKRRAGILLHPTSLPGRFGIGDLGPACTQFLDWAESAGLAYWQILPLGPTGFGDSPYQCFSAFAGNPMLISPEYLVRDGLLDAVHVDSWPELEGDVDYGFIINQKSGILHEAFNKLKSDPPADLYARFLEWIERPDIALWLDDYALFRALKKANDEKSWVDWPKPLKLRDPEALKNARAELSHDIQYQQFIQFLFFDQWASVQYQAKSRGIEIIGDAPIYVSFDSADTWANQSEFHLDANGHPTEVAGVPPDYFSETGQLWGNPLYNWDTMKSENYKWWIDRMKSIFSEVDIVRLDHFRGFMGYYAVPYGDPTAEHGRWVKGPGADFFEAVKAAIGDLPIIAEDLGEITDDVTEVRRQFFLPGMVILQFAWSPSPQDPLVADPGNSFLPHTHEVNSVVYTGTHDNDTTLGWYRSAPAAERDLVRRYLACGDDEVVWRLIRLALSSTAEVAIVPLQDLLALGSEARMNTPGSATGNWSWRFAWDDVPYWLAPQVAELVELFGRAAGDGPVDTAYRQSST